MIFRNQSKEEIERQLNEAYVHNVNDILTTMEELVREMGSTTGNLEAYSIRLTFKILVMDLLQKILKFYLKAN